MESITEKQDKLKYKIKLKLAELTEHQRLQVKRKVQKAMDISDSSYSRYINARTNETTDIPGVVLMCFADKLHCSVDDLYNND